MQNSFEVVQCTLLNKLISLGQPYSENVRQVINNWVKVIHKCGKGGGRTSLWLLGFYFDASLFVSCIFVSSFLSLFAWVLGFFFFSIEGNNLNIDGILYYLFALWHLFVKHDLLCDQLQWGAADAEIKVPSVENTELEGSSFKALGRSVYNHTCYAYLPGISSLLISTFPVHSSAFFPRISPEFFLC